jgi:hypothetical protein
LLTSQLCTLSTTGLRQVMLYRYCLQHN